MKISRKAYFLILIIEECAEIIHRTCKALRFGMDERWKPEDKTNRDLLEDELADLRAILELNRTENNIVSYTAAAEIKVDRKKEKVAKYLKYSEAPCGTLSSEEGYNPPVCFTKWKEEQGLIQKPQCRHGNDADTCDVCEDIRSGNVNTEG